MALLCGRSRKIDIVKTSLHGKMYRTKAPPTFRTSILYGQIFRCETRWLPMLGYWRKG